MEGISFDVETEVLVRPRFEKEDIAIEFEAGGWIKKPLSNQERRANIELLRQILVKKLSRAEIPAHTKKQSYEKWTVDRDASIAEAEDSNGLRPFGAIELPNKIW